MIKLAEEILSDHKKYKSQVFLLTSAMMQEGVSYIAKKLIKTLANIHEGDIFFYQRPDTGVEPAIGDEDNIKESFFSGLKKSYSLIIVDASGLMSNGFPIRLTDHCDTAILVVKAGVTDRALVKESIEKLKRHDLRISGIVLNDTRQLIPDAIYKHMR